VNYLFYFPEYLQADSLISLILSFALFLTGVIFFRSRELLLKIFLFAGGVAVGYFACSLDQFLHNWDEQYHALVAKNLMADFLKPVLYKNEILASSHWTGCHIWLHKQPLFLWEIAISMKIFGVNELAVRLPSIISHGLIILMVYDIGKFIKGNLAGILTALIFAYMKFPLTYVAGMYATDHNDIAFLLYVTASFWSLIKYRETQKIRYVILCGLFSGAAVLVKWLTGFLAIGVWGSYTLIFERKKVIKPILAGLIAVIVALPWQLYCYFNYRQIFLSEMSFNSKHVSEAVEGHSGNWLFHFSELKNLYSDTDIIFILL
jgi:4-amino-4-deoxy-L-arabinose transferase